jgi:Isochorismatase family
MTDARRHNPRSIAAKVKTPIPLASRAKTEVSVLSTALGAIDHGYRVVIAQDGLQLIGSGA